MKYKFLSHTADAKFHSFGKTLEESFENSVHALINIICKDKIKKITKKIIKSEGKDLEELLYNFLEEFLFLIDTRNFIPSEIIKIKIYRKGDGYKLNSEVIGDDLKNYNTQTGIKAITYNEMFVIKEKEGYKCQVVVDI
jgi:SHS2 domain-containing protein